MKRSSFVLSAIILTLGGFFAKAIGAIYKIPLTNILGSSGMGIYYLVFPIYSLVIVLCSSGISVALSTEVAKCRKIHHRYNEQKLLRIALVISFLLSLILSIVIIVLSTVLSEFQGNINARLGYIAISPAIILSTLIATIRGYFQGIENMVPTTVSMIIEQVVKLSVGLVLAHKLCVYGVSYAVLGAILGVTISEVVALIIIVINFIAYKGQLDYNYRNLKYKGKRKCDVGKICKSKKIYEKCKINIPQKVYLSNSKLIRYSNKVAFKKLMKLALPCTLSSILIPITTMIDSFLVINLLVDLGYTLAIATSLYGLWGGIVQTLISLPTIIVSAIATSLVPALSGLVVKNNSMEIKNKIAFYIKLSFVISIAMFVLFFIFAEDLLAFLYGDGLSSDVIDEMLICTTMLKFSSLSIIYYSFLQTFTTILQTMGKSQIPFFALLIGTIIRIILTILLTKVSAINIFGVVIANILFLTVADVILASYISRNIMLEYRLFDHLFKPVILGICTLLLCELIKFAFKNIISYMPLAIISGLIGMAVFVFLVYFGKIFTPKELEQFKFKRKKIIKK